MINNQCLWGVARGVARPGGGGLIAAALLSACAVAEPLEEIESDSGAAEDLAALAAYAETAGEDGSAVVERSGRPERPTPGAAGIGDPLFPTSGNGGYDVAHYILDLRYATATPSDPLAGTVRIIARATHALSRFNLDFAGDRVGAVRVNGRTAAFVRDGAELVITPGRAIDRGDLFVITVSDFAATPQEPTPDFLLGAPFFYTPDGSGWAAQPDNAHVIFPSNDHPSDKASFSFRIDTPAGTNAIANGIELGVSHRRGRTVHLFEQRQPMATELAQVAVGDFAVISRGRRSGTVVRDVVPTRLVAELEPTLSPVTNHLAFMENLVGSYPFNSYGTFVVDAQLGFALETQTLSLFQIGFFNLPPERYEQVMVHELAHQWFGNSVAPSRWSDVWLNEGHASWYERIYPNGPDSPEFLDFQQQVYAFGDLLRTFFGPVASPLSGEPDMLFNSNVYIGGSTVLFALRQQVGDAAFRAIERTWVSRYRGKSASTADFIALASQVSGQDLTAFLTDWLYGSVTPPMPGHPDWEVLSELPPPPGLASAASSREALVQRIQALTGISLSRH